MQGIIKCFELSCKPEVPKLFIMKGQKIVG